MGGRREKDDGGSGVHCTFLYIFSGERTPSLIHIFGIFQWVSGGS